MNNGFFCLYKDGRLLWQKSPPEQKDILLKHFWPVNIDFRGNAWMVALEALAMGAKLDRIKELALKWGLTFDDSIELLKRMDPKKITKEMRVGLTMFITLVLEIQINDYWANVHEVMAEQRARAAELEKEKEEPKV